LKSPTVGDALGDAPTAVLADDLNEQRSSLVV
jgi:hypothetical protein